MTIDEGNKVIMLQALNDKHKMIFEAKGSGNEYDKKIKKIVKSI